MTFSPGPYGEHATAFKGHGKNPPLKVVQALADQAGFTRWSEARQVIEEVVAAVNAWDEEARTLGISPGVRREIAQQLDALQKANHALVTG